MKQFFKFMLASMLGFLLSSFVLILILFGIIASIASFSSKEPKPVAKNSVLHLQLTNEILDRATDNPFEGLEFGGFASTRTIGLNEILRNLRKAREDENIRGVFLDMSFVQTGWATLREVREELILFKESGKFIVAYGDFMTQGAYYLASVADEIYLNPEGIIDFRGFNAEIMFFRDMLKKIGVEVDILRHGEFKDAGEMFTRDRLSPESRMQTEAYVSSMWNSVLNDISSQRNLTINQLNEAADRYIGRTPEGALESGLITGIAHRDEIMENLREKLELKENQKPNLVDYARYNRTPLPDSMLPLGRRDKIAIVYGEGTVVLGRGGERNMGSERIAEALRTAREDTTVKAIVFRINSPGGVALAGDIILREAILAAESKPMVVSMGNVAASAGYQVAAYASKIVANPTTLTGSIGVFAVVPNMKGLFNDKLGIAFDNVKTNEFADLGSLNRPLTRAERELLQQSIERTYDNFINHVAEGRGLPLSTVDSMAQGRVWSGVDAKRIGLVDELGGLTRSIEVAAEIAGIEKYRLVEYPTTKDFFTRIMEGFASAEARIIKARLGDSYRIYQSITDVKENSGILMRMPYDVSIN